jgi:hypothetical protein
MQDLTEVKLGFGFYISDKLTRWNCHSNKHGFTDESILLLCLDDSEKSARLSD